MTQIISPWSGLEHIPEYRLEAAAARGTSVHAFCGDIAQGLDWITPPDEFAGYVQSFRAWFERYADEVLLVEEELEDPALEFCGHPDLIVRSTALGGVILPDLKTPIAFKKTWGCQVAAYKHLVKAARGIDVDRAGALRLFKDGRLAVLDDCTRDLPGYFAAFFGCLQAYKFFGGTP